MVNRENDFISWIVHDQKFINNIHELLNFWRMRVFGAYIGHRSWGDNDKRTCSCWGKIKVRYCCHANEKKILWMVMIESAWSRYWKYMMAWLRRWIEWPCQNWKNLILASFWVSRWDIFHAHVQGCMITLFCLIFIFN